jgi:hypothetical protein
MSSQTRRLIVGVALAAGLLGSGLFASVAAASTVTTNCAGLQTALNNAGGSAGGGSGDVVILDELCGSTATFTLPAGSAFTLEGAAGTTSGFDGEALVNHPELDGSAGVGAMTISNLTFEGVPETAPEALYLVQTGTGTLTLSGDTVTANVTSPTEPVLIHEDAGGYGTCTSAGGSLDITGSQFTNNYDVFSGDTSPDEINGGGGGALKIQFDCGYDSATLTGNTFSGNTAEAGNGDGAGGAVEIFDNYAFANVLPTVTQSGNVFDSNAVTQSGTPASDYGGGGEWTEGVSLHSTNDRFSRNTLPGTSGASKWAWGAGLAIVNNDCPQPPAQETESTLTSDIVAANSIIDASSASATDAQGAGIYLGCGFEPQLDTNHLVLSDSTVTANSVSPAGAGAIAGIDGHASDQLVLNNSILDGDLGGAEIGGFGGTGGSLTASNSDVCSGAAPAAGSANICADPKLVDDGNASSFDIHETASSPTIDAGSDALVPSGLTTDFFGSPRELTSVPGACPVDIGAAEYASTCSVPGAPAAVSAVAQVDGATVSFTPPATNGAPITSYIVTASPGGATATGTAGPISLVGLRPTTAYTFTVTAVNALGASAPSAPSAVLTTLAPPKLSGLKLGLVSFFAATKGGAITHKQGVGTPLTYKDSEAGMSTFALYRVKFGVKHGGRCVTGQAKTSHQRCPRYIAVGSFTHNDVAGKNKLRFSGRLHGAPLKSGLYELRITATLDGVAGNTVKVRLDIF